MTGDSACRDKETGRCRYKENVNRIRNGLNALDENRKMTLKFQTWVASSWGIPEPHFLTYKEK